MGGGTTALEAMSVNRKVIGSDINSLSLFVAKVKTTPLGPEEEKEVKVWVRTSVKTQSCRHELVSDDESAPKNLSAPSVRWLKKTIALFKQSASQLPSDGSRDFAKCILLNVGQWALNGRRRIPTVTEFRARVESVACEMLQSNSELANSVNWVSSEHRPILRRADAEHIYLDEKIVSAGPVDLVVTSPPYPGIHMLYHRWQVDGRKETDAPYWIAGCLDGAGASHYNFADRKLAAEGRYFDKALRSFSGIRSVMKPGSVLIQMIAFSNRARQLPKYLRMMEKAGFNEHREAGERRIWRSIPRRRWHATLQGRTSSSKEVVLVHVAR